MLHDRELVGEQFPDFGDAGIVAFCHQFVLEVVEPAHPREVFLLSHGLKQFPTHPVAQIVVAQAVAPVAAGRIHLFQMLNIAGLAVAALDDVQHVLGRLGPFPAVQAVHVLEGLDRGVVEPGFQLVAEVVVSELVDDHGGEHGPIGGVLGSESLRVFPVSAKPVCKVVPPPLRDAVG